VNPWPSQDGQVTIPYFSGLKIFLFIFHLLQEPKEHETQHWNLNLLKEECVKKIVGGQKRRTALKEMLLWK
jgi:hypothetical protein